MTGLYSLIHPFINQPLIHSSTYPLIHLSMKTVTSNSVYNSIVQKGTVSMAVVCSWNRLDKHVVRAESISSLKKKWLDESMDRDDKWVG